MNFQAFTKNNFLIIGRAGLDLYAEPLGSSIEEAKSFMPALGGSSGNIAAGLSKLGAKTSLVSCVSDDAVGRYTLNQLKHYKIASTYVKTIKGEFRNTLAMVENRMDGFQAVLYRNGAADFEITKAQVENIDYSKFGAIILTGTALAKNPSRAACIKAMQLAKKAGTPVAIDLDYRAYSWKNLSETLTTYQRACKYADIIIGNDDEFGVMAGAKAKGKSFAKNLVKDSDKIAIYKMGPKGSITSYKGKSFETPIFKVDAIKPVGAGDAFMAGPN